MHRYLPASGPLFSFGKPGCLARCADLVRQLSDYPYSIWNRSTYKVKHICKNSKADKPLNQKEILYLYLYITVQEKQAHIPHMYFTCGRADKERYTRSLNCYFKVWH